MDDGKRELRGAIAAQDEREREAGKKCGVPYELYGCDWPDAVAEEVIALRQRIAALEPKIDAAIKDAEWCLGKTMPEWSVTEAVSYIRVDEGRGHVCHISNHRSGDSGSRTADFIANAPNLVNLLKEVRAELASGGDDRGGKVGQ